MRNEYWAKWSAEHPAPPPRDYSVIESEIFNVPYGYNDVAAHEANFFESVRTRKTPFENQNFGNHAAIGCHLANYSYFKKTPAVWNADTKTITG